MAVTRKNTKKLDVVYVSETNKTLLSRYCDPRMLSTLLPFYNAEQIAEFFKLVKTWLAETDDLMPITSF
jgi:hypothetical protein